MSTIEIPLAVLIGIVLIGLIVALCLFVSAWSRNKARQLCEDYERQKRQAEIKARQTKERTDRAWRMIELRQEGKSVDDVIYNAARDYIKSVWAQDAKEEENRDK